MRVPLVQEAEPIIEALAVRMPRCLLPAQSPLSDPRGPKSGGPQHLGQGDVGILQRYLHVAASPAMSRMQPGHQGTTARRAHGVPGIGLGEAHPGRGQSVDVRRADLLLSLATDVTPAQVVGDDQDHVRDLGLPPRIEIVGGLRTGRSPGDGRGQEGGEQDRMEEPAAEHRSAEDGG